MSKRNVCHPSLRAAICLTRNPYLSPDLVPYNTAVCWIRRGPQDVVALEPDEFREARLLDRISRLEQQTVTLRAIVVLLITVMRILGIDLERARVPDAADKLRLLKALKSARRALQIVVATKIIGISPARYHSWIRGEASCSLEDESSCPESQPTRINAREISIMHRLVTSTKLLHMPIRTLALCAARAGQVVACVSTWFRIIADRGWIRPRLRLCRRSQRPESERTSPGPSITGPLCATDSGFSLHAATVARRDDPAGRCARAGGSVAALGDPSAATMPAPRHARCRPQRRLRLRCATRQCHASG